MTPRRAALAAALAVLAVATGCRSSIPTIERVVLVTFDTTRADRIGCYGYEKAETPTLDGLAARGALFEQAVSPVPVTLPSHSSIFTGLHPQDHQVRYNIFYRLTPEHATLAESLKEAGFATAAFPASHIVAAHFGLDQGFDTYAQPPKREQDDPDHPDATYRRAKDGADLAMEWLASQRGKRAFAWLHFYDPHVPYDPPFPYSSRFRDRLYDGEIAYADAQLGRVIEALRADPLWDRTLLIVTADHGEGLYDHGERYHSMLAYETTQHVPLIILGPGISRTRVDEPVMLADLMPTILDLAGIPEPNPLRGTSLRPALEGGSLPRRDIYFESLAGAIVYAWAEINGLRHGNWKLIDSLDPELFDLDSDPEEQSNLAASEPLRLEELREALKALLQPISDAGEGADAGPTLSSEMLRDVMALGYIAGSTSASSGADAPHPRHLVDLQPELLDAQMAMLRGEYDHVEEVCLYALSRDPTNKWALQSIVGALIGQKRLDEALERARYLVELVHQAEESHAVLARVHHERAEPAEAVAALAVGLEEFPDSEYLRYLWLVAGFDTAESGVCDQAVPEAVARHSTSGRMLVLRARCEALAGDPERSLETLRAAVDLQFRRLDIVETAPDMAAVVEMPGFAELKLTAGLELDVADSVTVTPITLPEGP